jgi:hypothetical protein
MIDLSHFHGTENWYRHSLVRKMLYTDGVQYLAEKASAYWLLDKIACMQLDATVGQHEFQVWKLDTKALTINVEDGDGGEVYSEKLTFTDFPLEKIELWVEGNVILLPSEH